MNYKMFNDLLKANGISPEHVSLIRQTDRRLTKQGKPLYYLWKHEPENYERYAQLYKEKSFKVGHYLAFFIVTPLKETVFIDLQEVINVKEKIPAVKYKYLSKTDNRARAEYTLSYDDRLKEYEKRLVIDWGKTYIVWCQKAINNNKRIIKILEEDC